MNLNKAMYLGFRQLARVGYVASLPTLLQGYFHPTTGSDYGVTFRDKIRLMRQIRKISKSEAGNWCNPIELLIISTRALQVPASAEGPIVECGCYRGGSTSALSLVAEMCDRELHVFDSFKGLPEPDEQDISGRIPDDYAWWVLTIPMAGDMQGAEGALAASRKEVRRNISKYGDFSRCTLHEGYFEETLPDFDEDFVFGFFDVDFPSSYETCLENLWPQLHEDGYLFVHEARHYQVSKLFYDSEWWEDTLDQKPPGLVGAGKGLGLRTEPDKNGYHSDIAVTVPIKEKGE